MGCDSQFDEYHTTVKNVSDTAMTTYPSTTSIGTTTDFSNAIGTTFHISPYREWHWDWHSCGCYHTYHSQHEHDFVQAAGERLLFCTKCGETKWLPKPKKRRTEQPAD